MFFLRVCTVAAAMAKRANVVRDTSLKNQLPRLRALRKLGTDKMLAVALLVQSLTDQGKKK